MSALPPPPPAAVSIGAERYDAELAVLRDDRIIAGYMARHTNPHTVATYRTSIDRWRTWCTLNGVDMIAPEVGDCARYLRTIMDTTSRNATVGTRVTPVRAMIEWAIREGHTPGPNRWREVKLPPRPAGSSTASLDRDDHARLLAWAADQSAEDHALIRLLAVTALRREEAICFRLDDLTERDGAWRYRLRGKGGKEADIELDDVTVDAVRAVAQGRTGGYLFQGGTRGHMSPRKAANLVERARRQAAVPHVSPHGLRKSVGTRILEETGDITAAQKHLRHSSPATTARHYDGRDGVQSAALAAVLNATRHEPGNSAAPLA